MTRVLVADDDLELRSAVAHFLAEDGMTVQVARSGSEVLAKLAEGAVDLLVTDVMMPELSGLHAAAMARTAGEQIPILVMTARRDPWVAESVRKLQCADVLYKPFSSDELVEHAHALLARNEAPSSSSVKEEPHVFPPALVPILRRNVPQGSCLASATDEDLTELLSVVFFAALETEEGERNPVRVVFVGTGPELEEEVSERAAKPLYRWSSVRFVVARAFTAGELVKLAKATTDSRVFIQVRLFENRLIITGLSREGVNLEGDTALKILADKPGGLSIRMGRNHVLDYERGRVQSLPTGVLITPARRALELASEHSGLPAAAAERYLDVVQQLVAGLSAQGSGGILVFGADASTEIAQGPGYRTHPDVSLASLLVRLHQVQSHAEIAVPAEREQDQLAIGTLQAELQHTILELGALTAMDGATVLDRSLALLGFGIVLPVDGAAATVDGSAEGGTARMVIVEAEDLDAMNVRTFDLGSRGTRHRAAATYAWNHPGSVVFVASKDGDLGCLFRKDGEPRVVLWRFRAADLRST